VGLVLTLRLLLNIYYEISYETICLFYIKLLITIFGVYDKL